MNQPHQPPSPPQMPSAATAARNGWRTFGIVVITVLVTLGLAYWLFSAYVFRTSFTPVQLNVKEQRQLEQKLRRLEGGAKQAPAAPARLEPEPYSERGASREISLNEKELNALLAHNTNLASKLAIDLSDNLASAKLLVDLDPEFPVLGGKTVKLTAGMELGLADGRPRAVLKGVSLWGVPLPNAWLGNLKHVDLIQEFGQSGGFWQTLNEGVEEIEVREGKLRIKLRE